MHFEHRYFGRTHGETGPVRSALCFAPDTRRVPTHFTGLVDRRLPFREGMAALHAVVVSDLRPVQKDRSAYLAWRADQDGLELASLLAGAKLQRAGLQAEVKRLRHRLNEVSEGLQVARKPYLKARQEYYSWLYRNDRGAWIVLDPVVTVHPDQLFFECFSQDESSYARFGCGYEAFAEVGELACGTTNVDYSRKLASEFEKLRTYRDTRLTVDPTGFEVATDSDDAHREVKIDLPDSWVRGFLQVGAAMNLPGARLRMHPMDLHNLLFVLKSRRETHGPRSLRFHLTGALRVDIEPFGITVPLARSIVRDNVGIDGKAMREVRVWGRRRLAVLERLLPVCSRVDVTLLGTGLPSFWVADLGGLDFTLGLSGWTANDWSRHGAFDLMAPRGEVDAPTALAVFACLKSGWFAPAEAIAAKLGIARATVEAALLQLTQAGRVMFDLSRRVFRARELFADPLPMDQLRYASPQEASARALVAANGVLSLQSSEVDGVWVLRGEVQGPRTQFRSEARIDGDERLQSARCSCSFYRHNKLFKGPCAHVLALRMAWQARAQASVAS